MPLDTPKKRVFHEPDKARRISHWDLDYLPRAQVESLYAEKAALENGSSTGDPVPGRPALSRGTTGAILIAAGLGLMGLGVLVGRWLAG